MNAKGSGCGRKGSSGWSFTVDASIYTFAPIDNERLEGLAYLAETLSQWIIDEFGLHNVSFDTIGSTIDAPTSNRDARGQGFYYTHLDVEDDTLAKGDYRSRQDIDVINADMLNESQDMRSYSIEDCQIRTWVAFDLRVHISKTIRELISEGIKRWLESVVG